MKKICKLQALYKPAESCPVPLPKLFIPQNIEIDLELTEHQSLMAKPDSLMNYNDKIYKRCIVLDETTVYNQNKLFEKRMFSF